MRNVQQQRRGGRGQGYKGNYKNYNNYASGNKPQEWKNFKFTIGGPDQAARYELGVKLFLIELKTQESTCDSEKLIDAREREISIIRGQQECVGIRNFMF